MHTNRRKTFERIDRTKERNKTDIRATTCNPFEGKFNNPCEREVSPGYHRRWKYGFEQDIVLFNL